ncbi:MAG: InlB B-repeat-containing protein [Bacteroidaceae bacterium]|nr:InlB B-repeat-containing protein [Bacteroidaceae bacterium]
MKKLLLIAITALTSLVAMAETKTFTDQLTVSVNGESSTQQATVMVEDLGNGNINFRLPNFVLVATSEDPETGEVTEAKMGVGNIVVDNLPLTKGDNYNYFEYSGDLMITEGDMEGVDMWIGPMISPIPLVLTGKITNDKVYVNIDIDMMATLEQIIHVEFGKDLVEEKVFKDKLLVSVNEESSTQDATVIVQYPLVMNNEDPQSINFRLPNFVLVATSEDPETGEVTEAKMGVGNIIIDNLPLTAGKGFDTFSFQGDLMITEGDMEGVDMWIGPMISPIPLVLTGKITDDKVYVNIDIDMMATLGQIIHVEFGQDIKPSYTVTYAIDGETIATEQVEEGGTVTLPEAPEKEGYTFAGWTGVPETVTNDVTITGSYNINHYTVTYVIDGTTVGTEEVEYNGTPSAPEAPEKEGHTFAGWTGLPEKVTADVTVTGSYTVNTYTVYYKVDGRVVYSEEVAYGNPIPNFTITPESDDRYTRTFEGWDGEKYDTMPAHDVTYEAIISVVDGIESIHNSQFSNEVYDLSGRRVSQTKKGLYIKNGRVVVLK